MVDLAEARTVTLREIIIYMDEIGKLPITKLKSMLAEMRKDKTPVGEQACEMLKIIIAYKKENDGRIKTQC